MTPDPRVVRTRARVLDAAWEVLQEVGFEGVTVELVSDRSGVARSTLYRHWRTKEEVLRDAFAARAYGAELPRAGQDGLGAVTAYAREFATGMATLWGRAAVTLAVSAWDDSGRADAQRVFVEGNRRDLLVVIDRGLATGELPAQANREELVDRLIELLVAPVFYRYVFTERPATADDAAQLARLAWKQLAGS